MAEVQAQPKPSSRSCEAVVHSWPVVRPSGTVLPVTGAGAGVYSFTSTTVPLNVANWQSVPVKFASIRVAFAVPTLPKVPRQPRGDGEDRRGVAA